MLSITPLRASVAAAAVLLAGCASIPPDRGAAAVAELTAARGLTLPAADVAQRPADVDALLKQPLSLDQALRVALLASPRVQARLAELGFASAEVYQAGRLSNPVLSGAIGFTNTAGAADRFSFGLAGDFIRLLTMPARLRYARADFARVQQQVAAEIMQFGSEVGRSYYLAAAAQRSADIAALNADAADAGALLARQLAAAGNLEPLSLTECELIAAQAQLERNRADAAARRAHEALGQLLGLPTTAAWTLQALPAMPAHDALADESSLRNLALHRRLDLAAAEARAAALQNRYGYTRSTRLLGSGELGVQHERDSDRVRTTGPELRLELPLFDQGQGRIASAQAELQQAQAEAASLRLAVGHQVATALADVQEARDRTAWLRDQLLPLHDSAVEQAQKQYNFMLTGPFELLWARRQQIAAQNDYIDALRDYWTARVELSAALGGSATEAATSPSTNGQGG